MDPSAEMYLGRLNPVNRMAIQNVILTYPELRSCPVTMVCLTLDGIPKNYIQCQFYHSCQYRGTTYRIHMELDVPSYFPTEQLALFIRPDVGSKVFPIQGLVNPDGRIIYQPIAQIGRGITMMQFMQWLDQLFNETFPVCNDPIPALINSCKNLLYPDFISLYESVHSKEEELKANCESLKETSALLKDATEQAKGSITQLTEQKETLQRKLKELESVASLQRSGGNTLESNYRLAFSFSPDEKRQLMELEASEKAHKDLNDILSSMLSRENMEEGIDLIRTNAKELFEAKYLKGVVKAKLSSAAAPAPYVSRY
ncbi:hypothetical protein AV274_5269 [Blastocystis sp. ATCC 50177/Nand II]|uniref:Uncharacterized protein n=1 Tax=Blastocystis sp. subtype 1 (strain ATCC 50177 / NandII) TaxID=478820 RepID=A0A196SAC7_BLAHN|nr:hypothetical protein AV274_5269 [Blastocystis sp. ATCC 50177/Nand II]